MAAEDRSLLEAHELVIFQAPFEQTALGYKPTADYKEVWREKLPDVPDLEWVFVAFQFVDEVEGPWPPEGYTGRSLSVGDVFEIDGERWSVEPLGFEKRSSGDVRMGGVMLA